MKTMIVLAMHGVPPSDFPRGELMEYMALHTRYESSSLDPISRSRYNALEVKMRTWPRNKQNDPFHAASMELASRLNKNCNLEVLVGFNEFCAPDIMQAIGQASQQGAEKVIVTAPMLTRGGEYAEKDIPEIIEKARFVSPRF